MGGSFDWKRLLEQVLAPLNRNETGRYQRYDWEADNLAEWHDVPAGGIVIVEGCFSVRNELMSFYDARFWVHSPTQVCLERVIQREKNGAGNRQAWENQYRPEEEKYINVQRPHRNADIVIDGTGKIGNLPHYEVNVIRADDGWFYF
ncbi:uridine kinase family protein [Sulfobacillus thermosulfidooxidans]|uniref:uridine kinase family protein n=1 Tax=Sulfobacillus thermosulfidooxidans TaxID=28034 RepID=UPI0003728B27|nr:hypothetical protein [Sulfobacillus thermosulfidooxidans]